ncbi:MAG: tRNA pseudouridine(13) synthase TruD [Gammaproteobacteria bacterium]|nr:tRNA pseudouridine(13) synthase TruD [Gammaproteobacteria bacterium]MBT5826394.1 tRNA pseudouridine(13) synthase TruD [Gammaproteobacteria bacterium]MBT5965846.1 tRNA pseudouridine(13) synthase TruD [Gammaproteobacteria bacterium]MBT6420181.1 tRNA pseudouridine(13) synthase TruD [Gammaproteobacteria bacterium]MBT6575253.1 tRNA pseudouridine(13) synthase TruD [Gammaproteobacteria bacterium]
MNSTYSLPDWAYANGGAQSQGIIRTIPDDFIVNEIQSFELSGTGEHAFILIEKCSENTDYVARLLARFAGVRQRDVSYAGLKDRHARTRQWFSVWLPGKPDPDWQEINSDTIQVLEATRHSKKLKRGSLAGNQFNICVRDWIGDKAILEQQLQTIKTQGVPNYFGAQRFGREGANIAKAMALFSGEKVSRNLRSIYLSSARSFLFNHILSKRVASQTWNQALLGDVFMFDNSHSFFTAETLDESILKRVAQLDVHPTATLWGKGENQATAEVALQEQEIVEQFEQLAKGLCAFGVDQDRRALRSHIQELQWQFIDSKTLELSFTLNPGCYATALLREFVKVA